MADEKWALTPEELRSVERGHREYMKMKSKPVRPIRLSPPQNDTTSKVADTSPLSSETKTDNHQSS